MAEITASLVKELRERTGAGMMECKKALTESNGDIQAAADALRKSGLAKADKKASRVAAEGRIAMAQAPGKAVLVEINSETDFVAKDGNFLAFTDEVARVALESGAADVDTLKSARLGSGESIEEARSSLIAKVGENVQVRRMARMESGNTIGAYVHGGRIGVLVEVKGGNDDLARGLAMHVAAMNPPYVSPAHVPADFVAHEKEIALAQVKDSGKPPEILEKMVAGKIAKTLAEISLTGQPYVLDTNQTVEETRSSLIAKVGENVQVRRMARMESGNLIGAYVHGGRIWVLVELKGGSDELARGLAMHVAAMNPPYVSPAHVPADFVAREKEIALAQVKDSGKPAEILEKMVSGKIAKTLAEISLTGQPYVLDTNQTVEAALKAAGAEVLGFVRLAVGEGIEKQADDFHAEVMKQAGLA